MNKFLRQFIFFCAILFCWNFSFAQIGIPQIKNYSNLDYKGGTQNWDIDQDQNGIMYFANNEGLLTYNGKYWQLFPLPNKTIVRSIKINSDGKIYVGAQDEIGYFFPDDFGILKYHSLKNLIPEQERQFSDIWDIVIEDETIFFRTTTKILEFKEGAFSVYKSQGTWEFMGSANQQVFAQDTAKGLLTFKNGKWQNIDTPSELKNATITSILDYNSEALLITTLKNGLYLLYGSKIFL